MVKIRRIATITIALLCACVVVAQSAVLPNETREELASRIDRILKILGAVNRSGRLIDRGDIDNLKEEMKNLGARGLGTYLSALNETLIAAETEWKKGDKAAVGTMEDTMKFLADKAKEITAALKNIQEKIRNSQLLLSKALLPRISDQELRNAIDNRGLEIYRKKRLLSEDRIKRIQELKREQYSSLSSPCPTCNTPTPTASTFFSRIIDALIPSAYAEIAKDCPNLCADLATLAQCASCCQSAGFPAIEAFLQYIECIEGAELGGLACDPASTARFFLRLY